MLLLVLLLGTSLALLAPRRAAATRRSAAAASGAARRCAPRLTVVLVAAALGLTLAATPSAVAQEPAADQPAAEEPDGEPAVEEPVADQPAAEEPDGEPADEPGPDADPSAASPSATPSQPGTSSGTSSAEEAPSEAPAEEPAQWEVTDPTVFGVGDSLFHQCGSSMGLGARSLGLIGWWGGTTTDMRRRLTTTAGSWPYTTEASHLTEVRDFRAAGSWVIGLGTNDVRFIGIDEYRANVEWFLQQANGRPVLWFDIFNAGLPAQADAFNAVLHDAAARWPNLRILPWNRFVTDHRWALHPDGVHLASAGAGCREGRFALIREAIPPVAGQTEPLTPVEPPASSQPGIDAIAAHPQSGSLGATTSAVECDLRDGGCRQQYQHGVIAWSRATGAHAVPSRLSDTWMGNFSDIGPLGYPVAEAVCGQPQGGCHQHFQHGLMLWSPATGSRFVFEPMLAAWNTSGGVHGPLGYPESTSSCALRGGGCYQSFQGGAVYWSPGTGAQISAGAVYDRWAAQSWENGRLGYPTTGVWCGLRDGGCFQSFQGGNVHWSPRTGARITSGAIYQRWADYGWEARRLGYPTGEQHCGLRDGGCFQAFQGGTVHWSPATGAQVSWGAVLDRWASYGWETGRLGYPTGGEHCGLRGGGCFQAFQGGSIHWSPAGGAHVTWGAIHDRWAAQGWEGGRLGYPTGGEHCGLRGGGCFQTFQGGIVHWSPATGAQITWGAVYDRWASHGWETGRLGYPVSGEHCGLRGGGCFQTFQGGTIHWSPAGGAHATWGAIHDHWARQGWETGRLGYPTGGEYPVPGGWAQRFQGGVVSFVGGRIR